VTSTEPVSLATAPHARWALEVAEVLAAALLLAILAPLIAAVMLCVWLEDGGSPLFAHPRIGRGGRVFVCLKFRSMHPDAERRLAEHLLGNEAARIEWAMTRKLRRDPRVTRVGAVLRSTSLDELPQLFNVLRREMSLVGPRPIVAAEVGRYGRYFPAYCSIRPGITGLWQVSGRSDVTYRRRVAMDVVYARHRCMGLYLRVLVLTVPAVLRRRGAY
jgi:exopolysaccharide production protein ExoY